MSGKTIWIGFVAVLFALSLVTVTGCQKDGEKKEPAKKEAAKKEPAKQEPAKKEVPEKAEEPAEPAKAPAEAVPEEEPKKEETPPEPPPKTAYDALLEARGLYAGVTGEAGKLEAFLAAAGKVYAEYPDSDEGFAAYVDGAKARTDYVVAGLADPALTARLMVADGKLQAGQQPTPEQTALYYKALALEFQGKVAEASKEESGRPLTAAAALLTYLHDETMEAAGKTEGNALVIPTEWKKAPAPAAEEAPTAEAADAATGEAQQGEAEEKPAPAEKEAAPEAAPTTEVKVAGADVSTLLALATGDNAVTLQARTVVLSRLAAAMDEADKGPTQYFDWWQTVAAKSGKVLCAACGQLDQVKEEYLDEVLYLPGNQGIVCKAARADVESGIPVAEAVARHCAAELGLAEGDLALATPVNVLAFRFYALAAQMLTPPPTAGENAFYARYDAVAKRVKDHLLRKIALFPAIETFPVDQWEASKDKVVLQSDLAAGAPAWSFMPVEMVVVDEKGVNESMRPVADTTALPFAFADAAEQLRFPGKLIADVEAIAKEIEAKHAALKEQKATYDDRLGAYLEEVTIRGTLFKKPDFSIPSVIDAAKKLSEKAGGLEAAIFPYLMGAESAIVNHKRPEWPEFKDTVGKAAAYAVDQETPALLFKRVVDSLYYADYKDNRLVKGTGAFDTVPTVYFTEKFVADEVLDTTYKRPVLVYITDDGTVRFYPPTDKTRKGKMTAKRSPRKRDTQWPGKYRTVEDPRVPDPLWNLFMAYTKAGSKKFEEDVAGIAAEMKKKWDNGNVFYVMAEDKAPSGIVVKVADILSRLPENEPIAALDKAFPGYACDAQAAPERCINNIVVLFPDVEVPYLPGKKKVKEVETKVYCDKKDIEQKIAAKRGAIKFCYDPELQKNPNLKGKVIYNFTIGSTGRITQISVANDGLGNGKVVNCTMNIIKQINFRRPIGGECVIRYPYVFKP